MNKLKDILVLLMVLLLFYCTLRSDMVLYVQLCCTFVPISIRFGPRLQIQQTKEMIHSIWQLLLVENELLLAHRGLEHSRMTSNRPKLLPAGRDSRSWSIKKFLNSFSSSLASNRLFFNKLIQQLQLFFQIMLFPMFH